MTADAVTRDWEDFDALRRLEEDRIMRLRNAADTVETQENTTVFTYRIEAPTERPYPSVLDVLFDNASLGTVESLHPLWGYCQQCASGKVARAIHREGKHLGSAFIQCGGCGDHGETRFFINNNQTDGGWVTDRSRWDDAPRYRVVNARNRCFKPSYRGIDHFFELMPAVPCKRSRSIINLDHRPRTWVADDKTAAGLFLTDDAIEQWRTADKAFHGDIDFSQSNFRYPDNTIIHEYAERQQRAASPGA